MVISHPNRTAMIKTAYQMLVWEVTVKEDIDILNCLGLLIALISMRLTHMNVYKIIPLKPNPILPIPTDAATQKNKHILSSRGAGVEWETSEGKGVSMGLLGPMLCSWQRRQGSLQQEIWSRVCQCYKMEAPSAVAMHLGWQPNSRYNWDVNELWSDLAVFLKIQSPPKMEVHTGQVS